MTGVTGRSAPRKARIADALCRCGGAIVEISKRDVSSPGRVHQERPDVAAGFLAVDFLPGACVQRALLRVAGIRDTGMGWRQYALAVLVFNLLGALLLYALQRLRGRLSRGRHWT